MPKNSLEFSPSIPIPAHLVSQVQSKLAYVDESISAAHITETGDQIVLELHTAPNKESAVSLREKIQYVVDEMSKGSFQPKVEVLEDNRETLVPFDLDPMSELLARGEISEEETGVFTFGPLFSRLVEYFETRFLELAASFDAQPYRFPTLMSARMLDRVDYFRAFPHSLTFATHLREDLDVINQFAEEAS